MSDHSNSRRNFLRQLSCTLCAGGASAFLPQLDLISSAAAQSTVPGYRALVCVYLAGGNDAWNMGVPYGQARDDDVEVGVEARLTREKVPLLDERRAQAPLRRGRGRTQRGAHEARLARAGETSALVHRHEHDGQARPAVEGGV